MAWNRIRIRFDRRWLWRSLMVVLILAGCRLAGGPLWRYTVRTVLNIQADRTWAHRDREQQPRPGDGVAWLRIPVAGIDSLVLFDANDRNLRYFPCLSRFGAMPGDLGTSLIQGHRDQQFAGLAKLKKGDRVHVETRSGVQLTYIVQESEICSPEALDARFQSFAKFQGLVLSTCYPFQFFGAAPQRYLLWLKEASAHYDQAPEPVADPGQTPVEAWALPVFAGFGL